MYDVKLMSSIFLRQILDCWCCDIYRYTAFTAFLKKVCYVLL